MKRVLIAACLSVTCAVTLAAQTPGSTGQTPTSTGQTPSKAEQSTSAEKSVTLKGCLKAGSEAGTFVLADASSATAATGTTGTAASAAPSMKNQTVQLIGAPAGTDLKGHVGHTVEITGMLVPQGSKTGAGAAAGAGSTGSTGAGSKAGDMPRLNVKSMKHVDAKCQ